MANYLLKEDGDYLLKEDGDKITLQVGTSPSATPSVSPSLSPSLSASLSVSLSPSLSISLSPSPTPSVSSSLSPSLSLSPSFSPSLSPSASASPSPSETPSASPSITHSASPSSSISPSPSEGYQRYSRGNLANKARYKYGGIGGVRYLYGQRLRYGGERGVAVGDDDLDTTYTDAEEVNVGQTDATRVGQTGILEFMVHLYKDFVDEEGYVTIAWFGRSSLEATRSTIFLQIYNQETSLWETIASNNTAREDEDIEFYVTLLDLTNYKTARNTISCRIYQRAIL